MSKEVKKREKTEVSTEVNNVNTGEVIGSDVLIPRILLMQGLSVLVADRKAQQGDIVNSLTEEKLADPETTVEFVPLSIVNEWVNMEEVNGKFEFRGREPRTAINEHLNWEYEDNGAKWRRVKAINCFALLAKDMNTTLKAGEIPDINKVLLPVLLSFRSLSFSAGRVIATHMKKAEMLKQPGYNYSLTLGCKQVTNDKGTFYVFDCGGKATPMGKDARETAGYWADVVASSKVKVDEVNDEETVKTAEVC